MLTPILRFEQSKFIRATHEVTVKVSTLSCGSSFWNQCIVNDRSKVFTVIVRTLNIKIGPIANDVPGVDARSKIITKIKLPIQESVVSCRMFVA